MSAEPLLEASGVPPACVSRYNGEYFCTVLSAKIMSTGEAHVAFTVVGDMSMGQLQQPSHSKLSWRPSAEARDFRITPTEVRLEWNDERSRFSGTLVYQGVPMEQDVCFAYGSSGYSKVRMCFEVMPNSVVTLSAVREPDSALVVSCSSMAGTEISSVKVGDLQPQGDIAALRRLLVARLNIQEGQLILILPDGTLDADQGERLLDDVFYAGPVV